MKRLAKLLIVALVAGAVATIIVQRDRLRQLDRAELMTQFRDAIQSRIPGRSDKGESTEAAAGAEGIEVATESGVDDSDD